MLRHLQIVIALAGSTLCHAVDAPAEITQVEERLLAMAPYFNEFAADFSQRGTAAAAERVFPTAPLYEPETLGRPGAVTRLPNWGTTVSEWELGDTPMRRYQPGETAPLAWLPALVPEVGSLRIKTYDGELLPRGDTFVFRTRHQFLFGSKPGAPMAEAAAGVELDWGSDGERLFVIRWHLSSVKLTAANGSKPLLAVEALATAVPDEATREDLRRCRHEDYLVEMFEHPEDLREITAAGFPHLYLDQLTTESGEQHPGVSVVDINADGWDDLYVMRRWGPNRLLVNRGDGTFDERAGDYGLDIDGLCSCAIFADFDNDGDQDAFIGRTLERSMLLENDGGKFRDIAHQVHGARLPYLCSSVACADYDMDGLLDVYIGTYFGHTQGRKEGWQKRFLEPEHVTEHARRAAANTDLFYDFVAPPNLLLRNRGDGRFERAPEADSVMLWRATLQPTFADWDDDGDPDLLVTNDFGPDVMLRNDPGDDGRREFVEVTGEIAPDVKTNYFGMGGSWGDYDNDGRLDLYLSAMFSKAGTRITNRLSDYDVRARQSALGNILLRGVPSGKLVKTSGQNRGEHPVDQVGWAWGGQFFDPDNDGHLDLYAPTGYFTPPPGYSSEVDY